MTSFVGTWAVTRTCSPRARAVDASRMPLGSVSTSRSITTRYSTPRTEARSSASLSVPVTTCGRPVTSAHTSSAAPSWSWWKRCATALAPCTTSTRSCTAGSAASARYSCASRAAASSACSSSCRCWVSSAPRATPGGAATQRPGRAEDCAASPCRSRCRSARSVCGTGSVSRWARSGTSAAPSATSARYAPSWPSSRPIAPSNPSTPTPGRPAHHHLAGSGHGANPPRTSSPHHPPLCQGHATAAPTSAGQKPFTRQLCRAMQ